MEPFQGGPGTPTNEQQDREFASRSKVMAAAVWATALFIIALLIVGGGGLLILGVGFMSLLTWAAIVSPLLFVNGILLHKLRSNQTANVAQRKTKFSIVLIATGAIGLSILSAAVSFVYCSAEFSKALIHH